MKSVDSNTVSVALFLWLDWLRTSTNRAVSARNHLGAVCGDARLLLQEIQSALFFLQRDSKLNLWRFDVTITIVHVRGFIMKMNR